jgi:hypothetical protein
VQRQLQDNAQGLSPHIRKTFPKKIVAANTAMNSQAKAMMRSGT